MTPEDRQVIYDLVVVPGRGRQGSPEAVLLRFGTVDGHALGLSLLGDAVDREDGDDVEAALIVCFAFGMTPGHLELLVLLASAGWHRRHEDVASALDGLRAPGAVGALFHLTQWVPDYLAWDEGRGLGTGEDAGAGGGAGAEAVAGRSGRDRTRLRRETAVAPGSSLALAILRGHGWPGNCWQRSVAAGP